MSDRVMGGHPDVANPERRPGLGPRKGLTLLVAAENQRLVGKDQVSGDDIPERRLEVLVVGEFERPLEVWLDVIGGPKRLDRVVADPLDFGRAAGQPGSPVRRPARFRDDLGPDLLADGLLASGSPGFLKTLAPIPTLSPSKPGSR